MKYNELHRLLKKAGCTEVKSKGGGHRKWYSPITGKEFLTSHHLSEEVAEGTLRKIKKAAGLI